VVVLHGNDNLAPGMPIVVMAESAGSVAQWKTAIDDGFDLAAFEEV
jgi:hypothetical protein